MNGARVVRQGNEQYITLGGFIFNRSINMNCIEQFFCNGKFAGKQFIPGLLFGNNPVNTIAAGLDVFVYSNFAGRGQDKI